MHSPEAVCHYAVDTSIFYIASDTFHGMNSCVTLDHTYRLMLFLDAIIDYGTTLMLFHNQRKQDGEHADNRYTYIFTRL